MIIFFKKDYSSDTIDVYYSSVQSVEFFSLISASKYFLFSDDGGKNARSSDRFKGHAPATFHRRSRGEGDKTRILFSSLAVQLFVY